MGIKYLKNKNMKAKSILQSFIVALFVGDNNAIKLY